MRIAVVGAGISGLTAAWLLSREHEITVYEAADWVGGHTHTVDVPDENGRIWPVDTGFIVFNEENYPHFSGLLEKLGVESQLTNMSFSVRGEDSGIEWNGSSLNQVFAQRRNLFRPRFWRFVRDILRFNKETRAALPDLDEETSVGDWLAARNYGALFSSHYLVAMGASLWSCPPGTFLNFPIRFVAEFLLNHKLLQLRGRPLWRVVKGGSRTYVEKLTAPFAERIRTSTPVRGIARDADGVTVRTDAGEERFEEIVLGVHSDQALRMLEDPSDAEREVLAAFPYQRNDVMLHTDRRPLPRRRRAWGAWNFHVRGGGREESTLTYQMNILQGLATETSFNVTLNEDDLVDPDRVLGRYVYHHPIYARGRTGFQARRADLLRANRTSFCGAWWGFGFHEDGCRSGVEVAAAFGIAP